MPHSHDIIIIGGGICGLTAATTAARLGMNTLILTGQVLGGHLVSIEKVDGFPGHPEGIPGFDLCPATEEAAAEAGAEFVAEDATALEQTEEGWKVSCDNDDYTAPAVILAMGTSLKHLGVPGEQEFFGKGVSHCASCDAPMLRGKDVAVIGGGDSALQEALTLIPVCSKVTIITEGEALTGQKAYCDQIEEASNVEIRTGASVREIIGDGAVTGVKISAGSAEETLAVDSVFVFIGLKPASAIAPDALKDERGFVVADAGLRTAKPGSTLRGQSAQARPSGRRVLAAKAPRR